MESKAVMENHKSEHSQKTERDFMLIAASIQIKVIRKRIGKIQILHKKSKDPRKKMKYDA